MPENAINATESKMDDRDERSEIINLLAEMYSGGEIILWLTSPNELLDGKIANQMIEDGEADEVRIVIQRMLDGSYI